MALNDRILFSKQEPEPEMSIKETLQFVYDVLEEKGYNGINQITGYMISGDPSYITGYKDAKRLIYKLERDEIIEELLKAYLGK